jgi:hypothetical protein
MEVAVEILLEGHQRGTIGVIIVHEKGAKTRGSPNIVIVSNYFIFSFAAVFEKTLSGNN